LGVFSPGWALVMNLFFLLSFPLVALTAYGVMRHHGASRPAATACSALFGLLPYHFWQGEFHLFLAAYYAVPLGAHLVLATYRGEALFSRRRVRPRGVLAWASRRSLTTVLICCVIASAGLYYAAFTLVLLVFAAAVVVPTRRSWVTVANASLAAAAIAAVLAINVSPTLLYWARHGRDPEAFLRTPAQSNAGSLKVGDLVLPLTHHRISALGRLRRDYSGPLAAPEFASSEGESATLGVIATVGLVVSILVLVAAVLGRGRGARWDPGGRLTAVAAGAASSFVLATVGGRAIAHVVSPDIRQWTRASVFVGFFSLAAVALLLDRSAVRLRRRRRGGRVLAAVLLAAIGVAAFFDQTSSEFIPPYRQLAYHYDSDQAFVAAIERRLPPGSAVFQLPYMPWPEPGFVNRMTSFTPARGYLHSRALRWSYGAMRGRAADWQAQLVAYPVTVLAPAAVAAGFDGIYIDRLGYKGASAQRLEASLTRLLGLRPLVSADGRLSFFDARAYAARLRSTIGPGRWLALREATLRPVWLDAGAGTRSPPPPDFPISGVGIQGPVWIRGSGVLEAVDPSGQRRTVLFTARLSSAGAGDSAAMVLFPDGARLRLVAGGRPVTVCRALTVDRGSRIVVQTAARSTLRLDGARLIDAAFLPFLRPGCVSPAGP
ncbi:MAG: hypothetical protein JO039_02655, partial [Solirubrobacterales bacterium]|nr:hypothetical protein [Solirubrobacterales bacterium]